MKRVALVLLLLFAPVVAAAEFVVSTMGVTVAVPDNCGFTPTGDGWVRLHLINDTGSVRDFFVRSGQQYPLRALDIELPGGLNQTPTSVSFNDQEKCGYTRSYGLDECGNDLPIPKNIGFYAGQTLSGGGAILVRARTDLPSGAWRTYQLTAGEFALIDIGDCQLVDGSSLNYLTAVAP